MQLIKVTSTTYSNSNHWHWLFYIQFLCHFIYGVLLCANSIILNGYLEKVLNTFLCSARWWLLFVSFIICVYSYCITWFLIACVRFALFKNILFFFSIKVVYKTVWLKGMVVYLHKDVTGFASSCVKMTFITVHYVT